ncbi:thiosulfate ABC transporter substrate-binding protein CysP [Rosenbergiella australiborealis]|uniref:thiosulfate ABC transporter substrate-binding protein CysP n=1 Tax=Rosenbergiella australiborealis TaxID=1544696 RepID=UPI001F4E4A1C|nr:thiosulfate ABC transporter substrate-binding protein CysP [Rosenbergiella australiborealis]
MKRLCARLMAGCVVLTTPLAYPAQLLNSSYDVSRELYQSLNPLFIQQWDARHPQDKLIIRQSHGGSSKQALAILQGMSADVVTFNQVPDIQVLHDKGNLIPSDWQTRFANNSSPYYSTMAFVVRQGNPLQIKSWEDLVKPGVKVIYPNPKTSGNGRYTWLAAWGAFSITHGQNSPAVRTAMRQLVKNTQVADIGGRGATQSFVNHQLGDVLITFEAEARALQAHYPAEHFQVIVPQTNIKAEFPVTWIDRYTERARSTEVAKDYLNFLYQPEAQNILTRFYYRTYHATPQVVAQQHFPPVHFFTVEQQFGSWQQAMQSQFAPQGEFYRLQAVGSSL